MALLPSGRRTANGKSVSNQQGDGTLDLWHCPTCGCTTDWTATDPLLASVTLCLALLTVPRLVQFVVAMPNWRFAIITYQAVIQQPFRPAS